MECIRLIVNICLLLRLSGATDDSKFSGSEIKFYINK